MAERKVFGRLKKQIGEEIYKFEMKQDGIHVRQAHTRIVIVVPFAHVANLSKKQMEFMI